MTWPSFPTDELHKFRVSIGFALLALAVTSTIWLIASLASSTQAMNALVDEYNIKYPSAETVIPAGDVSKEANHHKIIMQRQVDLAGRMAYTAQGISVLIIICALYGGYSLVYGLSSWSKQQIQRDIFLELQVKTAELEYKKKEAEQAAS